MTKLMILGAGILQLPAIEKARTMGLEVVAVDMNPEAPGFQVEGVYREVISTIDTPKVMAAAKAHQIDGIMTLASDMPMQTVSEVARELNLVAISPEAALKATNKAVMRRALQEGQVPIPLFFEVADKASYLDAIKALEARGLPAIVKPADNSGSRGIVRLTSYDRQEVEEAYVYSLASSRSGLLLLEEYMEGPEVSVETLTVDGTCHIIQITDKLTSGAPYFVEMGHHQPSLLAREVQEAIKQVTIAANKALGIDSGPSHTEIKVTPEGPKIVEVGARLGGDNITSHLVPLSTGVDMVAACINIALNRPVDYRPTYSKGSAIRYLSSHQGRLLTLRGLEEARTATGVKEVTILAEPGQDIHDIRSSTDRLGYLICQGETAKDAIAKCQVALEQIKIEIGQ